jgi:hypothetical protein
VIAVGLGGFLLLANPRGTQPEPATQTHALFAQRTPYLATPARWWGSLTAWACRRGRSAQRCSCKPRRSHTVWRYRLFCRSRKGSSGGWRLPGSGVPPECSRPVCAGGQCERNFVPDPCAG